MHRSGTSVLGGVLERLGVCLPGEQIAADQHNPSGYFEWSSVVDLQERLLIDLDRWWPSYSGTKPLPKNWLLILRAPGSLTSGEIDAVFGVGPMAPAINLGFSGEL